MFNVLIVEDSVARGSTELRAALYASGCATVTTISLAEAEPLGNQRSGLPDLIVLNVSDMRLVQRMMTVSLRVPIVVVCPERDIDAMFLAGAAEAITLPVRAREAEGRIRRALRGRTPTTKEPTPRERALADELAAIQREKADLQRLVCVDALTGIANRRHAQSILDAEWRRAARERTPLAVVMLDLDYFHNYNQIYGHLGGDRCLQRVADAMARCLRRPCDCLGRYGGEEFIAILPNTNEAGARQVAESLRAAVEALGLEHTGSASASVVTVTAGFASAHNGRDVGVEQLIDAADTALMNAKAAGRNCVDGDVIRVRRTETKLGMQPLARITPRQRVG